MQMVWIYGHLLHNVASSLRASPLPSPVEWLQAYQRELLRQTASLFQVKVAAPCQQLHLLDPQGESLYVLSPSMVAVGQLLQAQRIVMEWKESGCINLDGE